MGVQIWPIRGSTRVVNLIRALCAPPPACDKVNYKIKISIWSTFIYLIIWSWFKSQRMEINVFFRFYIWFDLFKQVFGRFISAVRGEQRLYNLQLLYTNINNIKWNKISINCWFNDLVLLINPIVKMSNNPTDIRTGFRTQKLEYRSLANNLLVFGTWLGTSDLNIYICKNMLPILKRLESFLLSQIHRK